MTRGDVVGVEEAVEEAEVHGLRATARTGRKLLTQLYSEMNF
jgi:hypothetical protein